MIKTPDFLKNILGRSHSFSSEKINGGIAEQAAAYNATRSFSNRGSLCYAPSVNMLFATDGTVKACCHNHENSIGKYPQRSIKDIWESEDAKVFRSKMKEFRFLSGCSECVADFRTGKFNQMYSKSFDDMPRHAKYPSMMEFLLSNTCNLECVMCSGELSSAIRTNRDKLPPVESPYDENFINQLDDFIPYLSETRFSGAGEAFLVHLNYKLWDKLIALNPKCKITIQTNGTVLNARVKDYLSRGNFEIGVSLDSLQKETYESIRLNAELDKVLQNIECFAKYSSERNKSLTISVCVMRNNWKELPDFVLYCNKIGANLVLHKVWSPMDFALHNLPADELDSIYVELNKYSFTAANAIARNNAETYTYFLSVIKRWTTNARQREHNSADLKTLSSEVLLQQVKTNLSKYILESDMIENNHEALLQLCLNKLDGVLALWTDEMEKKKLLQKLYQVQPAEMMPMLKTRPIEKLFEMSKVN